MAESTFFTDGDAYERFMGRWSRAAGEQFLDWLSLPPALKWLDVGCGTGAFTELVLSQCAPSTIDAIDPAEDQISYARNRPGTRRATYRVGDAQSLPYADGAFDVAAMALVINFIPDPAKAVAEMARVLKPGGTAGNYVWDVLNNGFAQQPLRDAIAAMNVPLAPLPGMNKTTFDAMRGYFEGAGLRQVTTRAIAIEVTYASFDDYWASQTGLPNPAVQALRSMAEPDVARLKMGLRERLADRNGRVVYEARLNAIKGRLPG